MDSFIYSACMYVHTHAHTHMHTHAHARAHTHDYILPRESVQFPTLKTTKRWEIYRSEILTYAWHKKKVSEFFSPVQLIGSQFKPSHDQRIIIKFFSHKSVFFLRGS